MTKRERALKAIRHRRTDFIPYEVGFTRQAHARLVAYTGDADYADTIGNHIDTAYYDGFLTEIRPEYWRDDFGVVWNRTGVDKDIGVIDGLCLPEPDLSGYAFPPLDEARIRSVYEAMMRRGGGLFHFGGIGFSMFERAWTLRGMENLLMDMVTDPDFIDALLDAICEYNLQIVKIGLEYDIDGFHFGDDWGQQKGLIMGPTHWRRFIRPRMERMYAAVRGAGKIVSQHSCGDVSEIFSDLIDIGLNVYQTFQPEIYDLCAVQREYGRDLAFWGGISTQRLLPFATPQEVRRVTRETLDIFREAGGYIAAPTHAIPGDVPPENILAMIEVLQNQ